MKISEISIIKTSMRDYSILLIRTPGDSKAIPAMQLQIPTDLAVYIKRLIEADQEKNLLSELNNQIGVNNVDS